MLQDYEQSVPMELVGAPLRGLPWVPAIPSQFLFTVVDLKDQFFSVPLHEEDCEKFTFSIPAVNSSRPDSRYEWAALPQGMANTLAFCQQYLYSILSPYSDKDNTLLYVHMDDLSIGHLEESGLVPWITAIVDILQQHGFKTAPNKIQKSTLISYTGISINTHSSQSAWTPINPARAYRFIGVTKDTGGNELGKVLAAWRDWETRRVM